MARNYAMAYDCNLMTVPDLNEETIGKEISAVEAIVKSMSQEQRRILLLEVIRCVELKHKSLGNFNETEKAVKTLIENAVSPMSKFHAKGRSGQAVSCIGIHVPVEHITEAIIYRDVAYPTYCYNLNIMSSALVQKDQSYDALKAVELGADEFEVYMDEVLVQRKDWRSAYNRLVSLRTVCGSECKMRTAIQIDLCENGVDIYRATMTALMAGASTIAVATSPSSQLCFKKTTAACHAIKNFFVHTNRMAGFAYSSGIMDANKAFIGYKLVGKVLGEKWSTSEMLRFSDSRMLDSLVGTYE